ncbi:MAG: hypothetical protein OQK23_06625 [Rhodospirillales bacterium]|nr:hypothetical protein [Rhodospirillales bacterium]
MTIEKPPLTFPPDVAAYVEKTYAAAEVIFEYGSGGSTVMAAEMPGKTIVTVESDADWAASMNAVLDGAGILSRPVILHADIGPTGDWGAPVSEEKWRNFPDYSFGLWEHARRRALKPDVILIDGRFRVGCFLAACLNVTRRTTVLFDDYRDRENYHLAGSLFPPERFIDRMAVFTIEPVAVTNDIVPLLVKAFYLPG